jgi:hypothetical protein
MLSSRRSPTSTASARALEQHLSLEELELLWLQEQRTLAELLTPRQRALYMARWLSLQDNLRDVMARRGPRGGPPLR